MTFKKLNLTILVLLCLGILTTYCGIGNLIDDNSQNEQATVEYISFEDFGCRGNGLSKQTSEQISKVTFDDRNYVKSYSYQNDTLALVIHYTANCCPDFADSVTVTESNIDIYLKDNFAGCRCICEFENMFTFFASDLGEMQVKFHEKGPHDQNYTTVIDTAFTVN